MDIKLTGPQYREFIDALMDAYPTEAALSMMLRLELDKHLAHIATGTLTNMVFEVIGAAQAQGWTRELLTKALADTPHNDKLRLFAAQFDIQPDDAKSEQPSSNDGADPSSALQRLVQRSSRFVDLPTFAAQLVKIQLQVCRVEGIRLDV